MATKKQGGAVSDIEARVPLQAIVLADSFAQKFRPITLERPKVLLPLVNIPMIDYTLEWLSSAGVEEIMVFCCAHARKVEEYLEQSQWRTREGVKVTTIVSNNCVSAGDAMRLIDGQNVVRGDFILVSGDTVSNMSLTEVLEQHRERRKVDKQAIMTMVTKRVQYSKVTMQSRLGNDEQLFVLDSETKQLLYYDHGRDYWKGDSWNKDVPHSLRIDMDLLIGRQSIDLRSDLQDCHIDICAPEVLFLFTDNFDYQHIRREFVKGVLGDDIMGNKIYTYELTGEYAARIDNLRAYDAVSRDVMSRWTFPLVPDTCFADRHTNVKVGRMNVYKEQGVKVAQTAQLGHNVFVGEGTHIGENAVVVDSVLGKNCRVGNGARVVNSYVWDKVNIGEKAQVISSVLCDGVIIQPKAVLEPGTVLSFNVVIGESFHVPGWSKISRIPQPEEEESSDEELEYTSSGAKSPPRAQFPEAQLTELELALRGTSPAYPYNHSEVGVGGAGYRWPVRDEDEELRLSVAPIPEKNLRALKEKAEKLASVAGDHPLAYMSGSGEPSSRDSRTQGATGRMKEEEEEGEQERDAETETRDFYNEVADTFRRGVFEGVADANVKLEIMGLKSGYNKSFAQCASGIFRAMLDVVFHQKFPHANQGEVKTSTQKILKRWGPTLLNKFLLDNEDQVEVLLTLEEICEEGAHRKELTAIFSEIVQALYHFDLVGEDSIMMWANEKKEADEADRVFLKQCQPFITWLETAEEEESDDDPPPPLKKPAEKPQPAKATQADSASASSSGTKSTDTSAAPN